MKLNLYDQQLNRIAIIGSQFISCLWSEGYHTVQTFTLELQATADYKAKVKPDCYLGREDRSTLMVIETVQAANGRIIASGRQAARCLDDVAFIGTIQAGSQITAAIRDAYGGSSGYALFSIADSDLEAVYAHQISNKSILELCTIMCQAADVGFRAVRRGGAIQLEFYRPAEDPNLIFAEKYGNLALHSVTLSTGNLKNHAIVLGEGTDGDRVRVDTDLSGGGQRRSLIVDARDLSQEEGETEHSYQARLAARGFEKLLEQQQTWECSFSPLGQDLGRRFDLGDVLTVLLPEYGVKLRARLTRFTQKAQNNTITTEIEVGSITVTR